MNPCTMEALVQECMAQTMIALRLYIHATNTYCILLKGQTGNAPVMLVYMVPVMALASAAKQNTSCIAQFFWAGKMRSTSARVAIMSDCIFCVEAVLD